MSDDITLDASEPWPHPEVGTIIEYDADGGPTNVPDPRNVAIVGVIVLGGVVIDPGRWYTPEDWRRVGDDVSAFLLRRMALLRASGQWPASPVAN